MDHQPSIAFYDFDGTLVASNVVRRYAYYAKHLPSKSRAFLKCSKLVLSVPALMALDFYSRGLFNEIFYREYRGMKKEWLERLAEPVFDKVIRPAIYPGTKSLLEGDRAQGFRLTLVTGELDFIMQPVVRYFGFDDLISNALEFKDGVATGEVVPPLIAQAKKVSAMLDLCQRYNMSPAQARAYSDSFSDVPMLEAVGSPMAVNPDRRLKSVAAKRGWPVLHL